MLVHVVKVTFITPVFSRFLVQPTCFRNLIVMYIQPYDPNDGNFFKQDVEEIIKNMVIPNFNTRWFI